MSSRIWDIPQPLRAVIPVWPRDSEYSEARTWNLTDVCPVNVSKFSLSTHTGTHADAQLHYDAGGRPIGVVAHDAYLGLCRVIDLSIEFGGILEGLVLDDVSAGDCELIALPLRLETLDASPVRAILRNLP